MRRPCRDRVPRRHEDTLRPRGPASQLPPADAEVVVGHFTYGLFRVAVARADTAQDLRCVDPIDGEELSALRYFIDEAQARTWIASEVARQEGRAS